MLFGKEWMTLEEADKRGKTTFSGLAEGASPFNIDASRELEIAYIAAGEEKQSLIRFTLAGGNSIRVTQEHPMIDQLGTVVPAAAVELGSMLLTMEGLREVIRIDHAVDAGKVWHIFPRSKAPRENVVLAEGVATGSLRFQSVWADEASRLLLRRELSDETLEGLTD